MKTAIKEGKIKLGSIEINVAVLEDRTRIIIAEDLPKIFESQSTEVEMINFLKELNSFS